MNHLQKYIGMFQCRNSGMVSITYGNLHVITLSAQSCTAHIHILLLQSTIDPAVPSWNVCCSSRSIAASKTGYSWQNIVLLTIINIALSPYRSSTFTNTSQFYEALDGTTQSAAIDQVIQTCRQTLTYGGLFFPVQELKVSSLITDVNTLFKGNHV